MSRIRSTSKLVLKILFVALLLGFLSRKGLISLAEMRKVLDHPYRLATALLAMTAATLIAISRWKLLLEAQGVRISWQKTARLNLIGGFFNLALPGAVSGDIVKAFYIARENPGKRGHVFGSILFDRIIGVSGLVLVATLALLLGLGPLEGSRLIAAVQGFVLVAFSCVLAFYGVLFMVPTEKDPILRVLALATGRFKGAASLNRIYEGIRNYHPHRRMVLSSLGLSCIIHFLAALACMEFFFILEPASAAYPDLLGAFVAVPLGLLVTAVPVAPAGVGTGHAAFSWLFLLLDSSAGANIFSLNVLVQVLFGALGGLVYLRYRSEIPTS